MHWPAGCGYSWRTIPTRCASSARTGTRPSCCCGVSFRAPGAVSDLSRKFGCDPEGALQLARLAAQLGVTVRGFSFHVGSQAPVPLKHVEAIEACGALIRAARKEKLGRFDLLDIGGGFPIDYAQRVPDISRFCGPIRKRCMPCRRSCA